MTEILISAGHNPKHPGAKVADFIEHDEAVLWQRRTLELLHDLSADSVPTGTLREKVNYLNSRKPLLMVEIHFNDAAADKNNDGEITDDEHFGRGCETLYMPGSTKGRLCADLVQNELTQFLTPDRGVKEGYYQMNPAKGPDFILKETSCTALIVEPGFAVNYRKIQENREKGCIALAVGIRRALVALQTF